ncbi:MAG: UbiA family prenyltransferase [Bacteroidota bacterium]
MMKDNLIKSYRFFRALSLDIVIGAVLFSAFVARVFNTSVPEIIYVELAIAVWCIYTWDHLKDAKERGDHSLTFRHQFHKKHARILFLTFLLLLIAGASLVFFLPISTVYMGVAISIFVLMYFLIIHFYPTFYHKETLIAVLYGLGIFLGPVSCMEVFAGMELICYLIYTMLIAFTNLMIFSEFERESDQANGFPSLAIKLGRHSRLLIATILIIQFISLTVFYVTFSISTEIFSCFTLMNAVLALVYFGKKQSLKSEYYRILGDGIFFIPVVFLI